MVDTVQIGRKLIHKRQERRFISRAVQQTVAANTQTPVAEPKSGDLAALIQDFRDDAARMTPEEIAAEDAAFATPGQPRQAPAPGYKAAVALFRQWEEEAARMTPEEIAADDAVSEGLLENVEKYPLSLRIPDLSGHD